MEKQETARQKGFASGHTRTVKTIRNMKMSLETLQQGLANLIREPIPSNDYRIGVYEGTEAAIREHIEKLSQD